MTATVDVSGSAASVARAQPPKRRGPLSPFIGEGYIRPTIQTFVAPDIDRTAAALISKQHSLIDIHVSSTSGYRSAIYLGFYPWQITKGELQEAISICSTSIAEAAIYLWRNQMGPFRPLAHDEKGVNGGTHHANQFCKCSVGIVPVNLLEDQLPKLSRAIEKMAVLVWQDHFKRQRKCRKAEKAAALIAGGAA